MVFLIKKAGISFQTFQIIFIIAEKSFASFRFKLKYKTGIHWRIKFVSEISLNTKKKTSVEAKNMHFINIFETFKSELLLKITHSSFECTLKHSWIHWSTSESITWQLMSFVGWQKVDSTGRAFVVRCH